MSLPVAALTVIGTAVGGAASAYIDKEERKEEEAYRIAEEQRREERYRGVGEAANVEDGQEETDLQSLDQKDRDAAPVGARAPMMGERFRSSRRGLNKPGGLDRPAIQPQTTVRKGVMPQMQQSPVAARVQKANMQAKPAKSRYAYDPAKGAVVLQ